jgi:hypothetical protein
MSVSAEALPRFSVAYGINSGGILVLDTVWLVGAGGGEPPPPKKYLIRPPSGLNASKSPTGSPSSNIALVWFIA